MQAPLPIVLLLLAGLVAPTAAQFVNRATWLGSEQESVRPDFTRGTEYYLDRASYVVTPPWWNRGLPYFHDQFRYAVGSTSRTQFTIEGQFEQAAELGDGFAFGFHFLQSENRDTRFVRTALELDYALGDTTALFAQTEMFADKSLIDASLGAWLWRHDDQAVRVMLTAVDWTNEKSSVVEYTRDPYAAMVAAAFGGRDSHRLVLELGAQLPFTQQDLGTGDQLELQRYIGSAESHLRLCERDWLVAAIELERTEKHLQPLAAGDPLTEDLDRTFDQLRLEWWRDVATPWSVGVLHTYLREDGRRPFDPANDLRERRTEWLGIARASFALDDKLALEPQVLAGLLRDDYRDGVGTRNEDKFDGKISLHVRWIFSAKATLAAIVSSELDELAFGGGGVQFAATF